jgi:hypothetical protein
MSKIAGDAICFLVMEITSMEKTRLPGNDSIVGELYQNWGVKLEILWGLRHTMEIF